MVTIADFIKEKENIKKEMPLLGYDH